MWHQSAPITTKNTVAFAIHEHRISRWNYNYWVSLFPFVVLIFLSVCNRCIRYCRSHVILDHKDTWPMPSLSRWSEGRRHENILRKVLTQHYWE